MPETGESPATDFTVALLQEFVRLGIRHVVLAPGSRSQALALACAELERAGAIDLHVRLDERGAAFLALGIAVETGTPALVVTTSGTAVANLHPAVLEAHHSGVPLILLTADRPAELRGIRSNQTTDQPGIFGTAARLAADVSAPVGDPGEYAQARALAKQATDAATGTVTQNPGPVHLNLAFREPLSAATSGAWEAAGAPADEAIGAEVSEATIPESPDSREPYLVTPGLRTIVIAGHGAGPAAEEFARTGGWPLLAEVSSGSHFGPNLVVAYRELLREDDWGGQVERVIVFGHPTLSREVSALIQRDGQGDTSVETIVIAPTGAELYNPGHRVQTFARHAAPDAASVALAADRETRAWTGRWVMASRKLRDALDAEESGPDVAASVSADYRVRGGFAKAELAALRAPVTRELLVDAVWRASWPHDRLVFGASRLIREADRRVPGKKISVHSNRGLAGIDGTIATAAGIALASQGGPEPRSTGVTRVLLGDLTLLHDVGSLLQTPGEVRPRLQVIVGNDGGGTIFDSLEVATSAPAAAMDRVLYTPQQVDLAALATAYGWEYTLAAKRSELEKALTAPVQGPAIVEVPLRR
ncbi:2-succinyl-5-enolpyruvyl-6-hydroxy-3-cyclohexene-1-carboxylic-acid synthase [Glaciibacter superstes]|uniref:2-succinyl-5-enolpyruvyl-6-hydroxy-3- cyclohexene-1-carboxylic-acid synthase n=1 Tax=Glaciibacter superstes TaxID=501023 RepID=UPI0003B3415D|nr:2-succinyl-5-enolpyruvyl-6-hydroxy-3-cyclohexene-1-carboxylic-acid synthase [Glaciibacter superstes]